VSIMELRSLSPVLDGPVAGPTEQTRRSGVAMHKLPLPEQVAVTDRARRQLVVPSALPGLA
jgi:hypothetical protein